MFSSVDLELPAFPVAIPIAASLLVVLLVRLRRRGALTLPRVLSAAALCADVVLVLRSVLLPYPIVLGAARRDLAPWTVFLNLVPVVNSLADPTGPILNVVLFVPFGFLLPFIARVSWGRALLLGLAVSVGIEVVQLVGDVTISTGRIADVDDVLSNVVGTLIGFAVARLLLLAPPLARFAAASRFEPGG